MGEPSLQEILSDQIVRLVMRADKVDEQALKTLLEAASANIRDACPVPQDEADRSPSLSLSSRRYRLGVGIMLMNRNGAIFVGRRLDRSEEAWQMPQGGIEEGESPKHAARRELREELGTSQAEIVASTVSWLQYDLPDEVVKRRGHESWHGQTQKWFLMRFTGEDTDIDVAAEHPEFSEWKWVSAEELVRLIVPFKRPLYVAVLKEFDAHLKGGSR